MLTGNYRQEGIYTEISNFKTLVAQKSSDSKENRRERGSVGTGQDEIYSGRKRFSFAGDTKTACPRSMPQVRAPQCRTPCSASRQLTRQPYFLEWLGYVCRTGFGWKGVRVLDSAENHRKKKGAPAREHGSPLGPLWSFSGHSFFSPRLWVFPSFTFSFLYTLRAI